MRQRATAIVSWDEGRGVIVHADRRGNWMLPGGKLEETADGHEETALIGAVRELREETGLEARGALFLFRHEGAHNDHHVFLVQAHGQPTIVDRWEAPAIGVAGVDLRVTWLAVAPGFDVTGVKPFDSTRHVIQRYFALRDQHPALWEGLAALAASWGDDAAAQAPAAPAAQSGSRVPTPPTRAGQSTRLQIGAAVLELADADIVTQDVDAVVNAANTDLANGTGVSGALHRSAGARELEAACRKIGGCPTGEARITPGFKLKARHVIHAVGPIYRHHRPDEARRLLAGAYRASLELASKHGLRSIAFPSLSTGVYGYPADQAAPVALETVIAYMQAHPEVELVRFALRNDTRGHFETALEQVASRAHSQEKAR